MAESYTTQQSRLEEWYSRLVVFGAWVVCDTRTCCLVMVFALFSSRSCMLAAGGVPFCDRFVCGLLHVYELSHLLALVSKPCLVHSELTDGSGTAVRHRSMCRNG